MGKGKIVDKHYNVGAVIPANQGTAILLIGLIAGFVFFPGIVDAQENYSTWSDSQRIYINTTNSGANISGAVTNFPVLIRLNPSTFTRFSRTQPGGVDIRFATSAGAHLNYQIERWKDGTNNADTAEIWVRIPSISGNNNTQFIRMYYGKTGVADSSRSVAVFDSAVGFCGVWHLGESAGNVFDATYRGFQGSRNGNQAQVPGLIGYAQSYDGAGAFTDMGDVLNPVNRNFTVSTWVKRTTIGLHTLLAKSNGAAPNSTYGWVFTFNTTDNVHIFAASGGANWGEAASFNVMSTNAVTDLSSWHHVVAVIDKSSTANCRIYIDGANVTGGASGDITTVGNLVNTLPLRIASEADNENQCNGLIDEARIEWTARSADWIKLSYETQKATANSILPQTSSVPSITTQPVGASVQVGASVNFSVVAAATFNIGTNPLRYAWYKNSVTAGNIIAGQTTSAFSLTNVQLADSGNYYVVISNEYGSVTSNAARLTVTGSAPTITTQPLAVAVNQTEPAAFTVVASGLGMLTYQWYKVVNDQNTAITVPATGLNAATMTITNTVFSDSGLYRCVVTNTYGSVTSTSAKLTVLSGAPTITSQPAAVTVYQTQPATMTVVAAGIGMLSYQWYKVVNNQNTAITSAATGLTSASLTITATLISDGGLYRCVVSNTYGTVSSNTALLTVNDGSPVITVQPADLTVLENEAWSMSVTATTPSGTTLNYAWYKTGVATLLASTRTLSVSSAQLADAGSYYCIVGNTLGTSTTRAAILTVGANKVISNPIMLSGSWSADTRVALRVNRLAGLIHIIPDQVFTWEPDTVLIWYSSNGYPSAINLQTVNVKISMDRIRQNDQDFFDTLVTVSRLGCANYYFMGTVKWRNTVQALDTIPLLGDATTGAAVWMCDSSKLANPLTMAFGYTAPSDSVVVTVNGISNALVRWNLITEMVLRYQVAGGTWSEVVVPSTEIVPTSSSHIITVRNARFSDDVATVNWQLLFHGVNGNKSDTVKATSTIGAARPENSLTLAATEVKATEVTLSWTNAGAPYDSFRIWYATVPVPDDSIPPLVYSYEMAGGTLLTKNISNLRGLTEYHFGIQGARLGIWSNIPAAAKARATTPEDTSQAIRNTMKMFNVVYDSATNGLRVTYRVDPLGFQQRVGLSWLERGQAYIPLPSEFLEPSATPRVGDMTYTVDSVTAGATTTWQIPLSTTSPPIEYAKEYYFGGWVSKPQEKWALPTDSSIFYYAIPQPRMVPVVIFRNTDVVTAFSQQVVLQKVDPVDMVVNLRRIDDLPFNTSGLIQVSTMAVRLETNTVTPTRILVGLEYNAGLIPAGATPADVRMYHYDTLRGIWLLDTATIVADNVRPVLYVQALLSRCKYPFVLAVDTVLPTLTVGGDTASAVSWGDSIPMTLYVVDNIANPVVSLHAGRGDDQLRMHDTLKDLEIVTGVETPWVIHSDVVQGECGIRARFVVNDGRFSPIADVSRDITFTNADVLKPEKEQWIPLGATGVLDAPGVEQALDEYADATAWKYDKFTLRLFRYMGRAWQEYTTAGEALFAFVPGRVIWLKTRVDNAIDFGSGRSVTLKRPYTITLPGKSWTDFCLPYRFNVRIGDVLKANDPSLEASLQWYQWRKTDGSRFSAQEFYLLQNTVGKRTDTLYYIRPSGEKAAYTVWNDLADTVVLNLPPVPPLLSTVGAAKSAADQRNGWSVAVRSNAPDGELSPVFCAYVAGSGGTLAYPCPPSWSKVGVGIYDRQRKEVFGNVIARELNNGGYSYELVFENGLADRTMVHYTVERLAGSDMEIAVIDPVSGSIAAGEGSLSVEVAGNSREYRMLAIGSPEYVDGYGWKTERGAFTLSRIGPNPFRGALRIEYTVPYGGIESVRCEMLDQRGRVVWSARTAGKVHPGRNTLVWTPDRTAALATGAYFVRLVGYDGKGKKTGEKLAKVVYLR